MNNENSARLEWITTLDSPPEGSVLIDRDSNYVGRCHLGNGIFIPYSIGSSSICKSLDALIEIEPESYKLHIQDAQREKLVSKKKCDLGNSWLVRKEEGSFEKNEYMQKALKYEVEETKYFNQVFYKVHSPSYSQTQQLFVQ